jgi:hypothetical protein
MAQLPSYMGMPTSGSGGTNPLSQGTQPARAATELAGANDWILPVIGMSNQKGKFVAGGSPQWSGGFGYQKPASKGGHRHKGIDIYADAGSAIVSPVSGTIKSVGGGGGSGGKYVKVKGSDGYEYYFAHMQYTAGSISAGMQINAGTFLGGVGSTGNAKGTQSHVHFEIRKNGTSLNPQQFLQTGKVQNSAPMSSIPGLDSVEQVQAYIDEQVSAAYNMNAANAAGFDPAVWGGEAVATEDDIQRAQTQKGQTFLGSTLNSMSNALTGGGSRQPLARVSSAMQAVEGGDAVPSAVQQRQVVEK